MRAESREFGLANGYSPLAAGVACIDFDGTLFPFGELFAYNDPEPGAAEALRALKAAGWTIVIFTSRFSRRWITGEGVSFAAQAGYVRHQLKAHNIPFDEITAEKVPAEVYIDDRAIGYSSGQWPQIAEMLTGRSVE